MIASHVTETNKQFTFDITDLSILCEYSRPLITRTVWSVVERLPIRSDSQVAAHGFRMGIWGSKTTNGMVAHRQREFT